jgi:2-phosphosulfolactate phosphatase
MIGVAPGTMQQRGRVEFTRQSDYDVRFECGRQGLAALAEGELDAIVIVDVLSFSTCVAVAVERGALVFPYPWEKEGAAEFAAERGAVLAGPRWDPDAAPSLAPSSLLRIPAGTRLVLPSPNGSSLSFEAAAHGAVIAGCLRNRTAVAKHLSARRGPVAVIAAGERWPDGSLRPCFEDHLGAGSIVAEISGAKSPEAEAAAALFERFSGRIDEALRSCSSGRELVSRGFGADVEIASATDASGAAPVLVDGHYTAST